MIRYENDSGFFQISKEEDLGKTKIESNIEVDLVELLKIFDLIYKEENLEIETMKIYKSLNKNNLVEINGWKNIMF